MPDVPARGVALAGSPRALAILYARPRSTASRLVRPGDGTDVAPVVRRATVTSAP